MIPVRLYFALAGVLALFGFGFATGCKAGNARAAAAETRAIKAESELASTNTRLDAIVDRIEKVKKETERLRDAATAAADAERKSGSATRALVRGIPTGLDCEPTARAVAKVTPGLARKWRGE